MQQTAPRDPIAFTLREAFDAFYLPDLQATAQPATVAKYRSCLTRWERLTDNPPVGRIDNGRLSDFRAACQKDGLAPITFNRTWTHLRSVLWRLGPQERGNPQGLGILERVPYVRLLKEDFAFPRVATVDEANRIYEACVEARFPRTCVPAPEFWRAALVLLWNCGPRAGDLFSLRTEDVDFAKRQLRFVARKNKRAQVLPLNETALAHLQGIWSPRPFFFPRRPKCVLTGAGGTRLEFRRLQDLAGVDPPLTFQQLRKTCASQYDEHFGREIAAYVLGHALTGVTASWYINPTKRIVDAVNGLPQPESFRAAKRCCVAPPVRRTDFTFSASGVEYRGRRIPVPGRQAAALRALVAAGRPLNDAELCGVVFWDRPAAARQEIAALMCVLRSSLARALKLPEWHDPLPYEREAGRGWTLVLPPEADIRRQPIGREGSP